jgi:hypothetical protein
MSKAGSRLNIIAVVKAHRTNGKNTVGVTLPIQLGVAVGTRYVVKGTKLRIIFEAIESPTERPSP